MNTNIFAATNEVQHYRGLYSEWKTLGHGVALYKTQTRGYHVIRSSKSVYREDEVGRGIQC